MSNVLIVSRTQMGGGNVCIGGYDVGAGRNIRLLTATGGNQPGTAPFQIGETWNITYTPKHNLSAPHTEDVMVQSAQLINTLSAAGLAAFISQNCAIVAGGLNLLFGGAVHSPGHAASYIDSSHIPNHSVCFWKPITDLFHVNAFNKHKYHYADQTNDTYFSYVGLIPPVNVIPAGSIVRMSLARWWTAPTATSAACYLQVSGWY